MKTLPAKIALVTAIALGSLFSAEAALAQRYHAAPQTNYSEERPAGYQRFSPHDQQIIDEITRNDRNSGY